MPGGAGRGATGHRSLPRRRWPSPTCFLAYGSLDRQLLGAGNRFDFLEKNIFEKKCQFSLIF